MSTTKVIVRTLLVFLVALAVLSYLFSGFLVHPLFGGR